MKKQALFNSTNIWSTAPLYSQFSSFWRMQNTWSVMISYIAVHIDDRQWFILHMELDLREECWAKFCTEVATLMHLDNYLNQDYRCVYKTQRIIYIYIYSNVTSQTVYVQRYIVARTFNRCCHCNCQNTFPLYCCWCRCNCKKYKCSMLPWKCNNGFPLHCFRAIKYFIEPTVINNNEY